MAAGATRCEAIRIRDDVAFFQAGRAAFLNSVGDGTWRIRVAKALVWRYEWDGIQGRNQRCG